MTRGKAKQLRAAIEAASASLDDQTASTVPALYPEWAPSTLYTPSEWVQPDSTNPYMKGDKVIFNGQIYASVIDNNVWSPSAYPAGWEAVPC